MADKVYFEGGWKLDFVTDSYVFIKPGEYEIGTIPQADHVLCRVPCRLLPSLIELLDKEGQLPRRYKNEDREPDLKIIHRLLDIVEKK